MRDRVSSTIKAVWTISPSMLSARTGLVPRKGALENLSKEAFRQAVAGDPPRASLPAVGRAREKTIRRTGQAAYSDNDSVLQRAGKDTGESRPGWRSRSIAKSALREAECDASPLRSSSRSPGRVVLTDSRLGAAQSVSSAVRNLSVRRPTWGRGRGKSDTTVTIADFAPSKGACETVRVFVLVKVRDRTGLQEVQE